jgi:hypothetical protein
MAVRAAELALKCVVGGEEKLFSMAERADGLRSAEVDRRDYLFGGCVDDGNIVIEPVRHIQPLAILRQQSAAWIAADWNSRGHVIRRRGEIIHKTIRGRLPDACRVCSKAQ